MGARGGGMGGGGAPRVEGKKPGRRGDTKLWSLQIVHSTEFIHRACRFSFYGRLYGFRVSLWSAASLLGRAPLFFENSEIAPRSCAPRQPCTVGRAPRINSAWAWRPPFDRGRARHLQNLPCLHPSRRRCFRAHLSPLPSRQSGEASGKLPGATPFWAVVEASS